MVQYIEGSTVMVGTEVANITVIVDFYIRYIKDITDTTYIKKILTVW
jgi:hypothetical protein